MPGGCIGVVFLRNSDVEVSIGRRRKSRSARQNRYYWAVIIPMLQEAAGYRRAEEMHDALKIHFLLDRSNPGLPTVRSMRELSTTETEEYYAQCRQLGDELYGIYIPLPNEVDENVIAAPAVEILPALTARRPRQITGRR